MPSAKAEDKKKHETTGMFEGQNMRFKMEIVRILEILVFLIVVSWIV